mmetsp:Transcript_7980/g.15068  ORF Transcript_7980/g.15068 Transcript_7980/m.15068 type:complete len:784 (+) Transcript_7980:68-2419(+)
MPRKRSASGSSGSGRGRNHRSTRRSSPEKWRRRSPSSSPRRGGRRSRSRSRNGRAGSPRRAPANRGDAPRKPQAAVTQKPAKAPQDLPVLAFREQIVDLLVDNRMIVVVGETGSGKTTQIPQYLFDSERFREVFLAERPLRIAITQPRRVAAVAMARRVSQERGTTLGDLVGYTIRFEDRTGPKTCLRYMTDGVLLRECLGDPDLPGYDVVVLDEAHERSLHTDVLFALMKKAVANRAGQLRLLVTSATLDIAAFSKYFNDCPVLEVPGRKFKVDLHYHPVSKTERVQAAVNVALNLHVREGDGHILIFLTGMEECEQAVALANTKLQSLVESGKEVSDCLIVPLYGMMQSEDQRNVFDEVPEGCRKLVFSTNIAETSLTVAGVGFVVDSGYCKQKVFNPKTGMEALLVTEVSQVQATQRSGRAGRTQNGKCFRLYSEEAYQRSFPKVTVPEILRSNLCSVTLQMKAMGIDNVVNFDFMEAPDQVRLVKSLRILFLLGALDADGKLTPIGKTMAEFPLEPQYARALLAAQDLGCMDDAVTLVSILSAEGIWYRPPRKSGSEEVYTADMAQRRFFDPLGDHLTMLNVFRQWEENGCSAEWCKRNYLHHRALRQARDIRSQLMEQLERAGVPVSNVRGRGSRHGGVSKAAVLQAFCAGFYMQSARACAAGGGYLIVYENVLVKPEGGSVMSESAAEWVLYTELVGATIANCMMRTCSAVDHEWLKPLLPKLNEVDLQRLVGKQQPAKKKKEAVSEKDAAQLAKEKETKVLSARERFLARKAQGGR